MPPIFNIPKGLNVTPLDKYIQCRLHFGQRRFVVKIFKFRKISGRQNDNQGDLFSRTEWQVTQHPLGKFRIR